MQYKSANLRLAFSKSNGPVGEHLLQKIWIYDKITIYSCNETSN